MFGSYFRGSFIRCHSLPSYMQYYDGHPPEPSDTATHGRTPNLYGSRKRLRCHSVCLPIPVVSDVPGTREMREISLSIHTSRGLVVVAGCSHPGIEKILAASQQVEKRIFCILGGLHLVLTKSEEIQRIVHALRDYWRVEAIAPGHCTATGLCRVKRSIRRQIHVCWPGRLHRIAVMKQPNQRMQPTPVNGRG